MEEWCRLKKDAPSSCKSLLPTTQLYQQTALFMLKPELSSSNALMKSAVFICGGSKCDIRSICESAQTADKRVAEPQAETRNQGGESWSTQTSPPLFFFPALISSSPPALYCPPAAHIRMDGGPTSMRWAAEIDETKKRERARLMGGLERRKRSRHFQAALLWSAILSTSTWAHAEEENTTGNSPGSSVLCSEKGRKYEKAHPKSHLWHFGLCFKIKKHNLTESKGLTNVFRG